MYASGAKRRTRASVSSAGFASSALCLSVSALAFAGILQTELEINRKRKEEVVSPRKDPTLRKRINRVPFNDH